MRNKPHVLLLSRLGVSINRGSTVPLGAVSSDRTGLSAVPHLLSTVGHCCCELCPPINVLEHKSQVQVPLRTVDKALKACRLKVPCFSNLSNCHLNSLRFF